MRAIAQYSFQGNPQLPQLSFPQGAIIDAKPEKGVNQGWMFGSYMGRKGWFPESYVELQQEALSPPPQQQAPLRPRSSPVVTRISSLVADNDMPSLQDEKEDEGFSMMGGTPGDLFEGAPKPVYYTTQEQQSSPSFLKDPEEAPVDIYRHGAPKKRWYNGFNATSEYSPEISVQITSKAATPTPASSPDTTPTPVRSVKQVEVSPNSTVDFWTAHPGRTGGPAIPSPDQTQELRRGFEGLRDSETIQIVDEKKKRFPRIPKSIKKAAQKTVHAVTKH